MIKPEQIEREKIFKKKRLEYFLKQPNKFWEKQIELLNEKEYSLYEDRLKDIEGMSKNNPKNIIYDFGADLDIEKISKATVAKIIYFNLFSQYL